MAGKKTTPAVKESEIHVRLENLPDMAVLRAKVQNVLDSSSWWEIYGVDWAIVCFALLLFPVSLSLLRSVSLISIGFGMFTYGCIHAVLSTKAGHPAAHGAVVSSPKWNKFWTHIFVELIGSFSAELGYSIHVLSHHPHTNIIGLGDSAMWKAPFLPRYMYMFVAPLLVPALTPFFVFLQLKELGVKKALSSLAVIMTGLFINLSILMRFCDYTLPGAIFILFASRAALAIPYIHINIFQHIGLPMYSQKNRPKRIYQMSTGALNLARNPLLDLCFGHSLINCHVEHHLFPKLSDNMCLKVKPIVRDFLHENGLPYQEQTYWDRLKLFIDKYDDLMVKAPPITHFIGLQ